LAGIGTRSSTITLTARSGWGRRKMILCRTPRAEILDGPGPSAASSEARNRIAAPCSSAEAMPFA
jgi:hypothetical protein